MRLTRGISLVEVLVALLILSLGLLGFASLQAANLNLGNEAWLRSQATVMASDMIDRIRGNSATFEAGQYDHAFGAVAPAGRDCSAVDCNPIELADYDLAGWLSELAAQLPAGSGQIQRDTSGAVTELVVSVRWFDRAEQGAATLSMRAQP